MSRLEGTLQSELACECGGTLHYQRKRPVLVNSVFGKLTYQRAYYAGCTCGKGKAPVDEKPGLEPGAMTSGLAELLALAGIVMPYEKSAEWLQSYLLFDVSENTVRSETEKMGALQAQYEEELVRQSQDEAWLGQHQREARNVVARLYGALDAAKVRIEPARRRAKASQRMKIGAV